MEFQWLNTFITAADCGNFRRTAEILYISQPSVTVHIKQLEQELGIQLFDREGKKVKLTEAGRRYLVHAKRLLEVYQGGLEDIHSFSQGYSTKFSIAISPLIADTILPYVLKSYTNKHPEVEISVKIIESVGIEDAVLREEVDIGLSCLNSLHPQLISELLYKDNVMLVAPHDGRDSETAPPLDEEEVLTSNYLLTHNHPGYWDGLCHAVKTKYPKVKMMKVSQVHITKRFIVEGLGVSFLPTSTVRRELLEGRLIEVDCQTIHLPEANTYAIMKYDHSKQKEFLEFISNYRI
ncbi:MULTISPECIES: LysR family transcriptional regulator [Neobacillus]|uniref:LysR family transcriptional regulator n=1 Tax=Neobacillus rhizophilus TaxID=2833579 RepID=A0A942U933_9BACI|nr:MULTISPECIES: LysR family transcriptional regulator [Neobacillus]MBS4213754.1 LysR family transcriptional regulator [Neobacillus rhizophilus]MBU8917842.1 LysR family transcriptional regulator [Bacillus sp. FJAT-29953]